MLICLHAAWLCGNRLRNFTCTNNIGIDSLLIESSIIGTGTGIYVIVNKLFRFSCNRDSLWDVTMVLVAVPVLRVYW